MPGWTLDEPLELDQASKQSVYVDFFGPILRFHKCFRSCRWAALSACDPLLGQAWLLFFFGLAAEPAEKIRGYMHQMNIWIVKQLHKRHIQSGIHPHACMCDYIQEYIPKSRQTGRPTDEHTHTHIYVRNRSEGVRLHMYTYVCQPTYPSTYSSIPLSPYLSIFLSLYPTIYLDISTYPAI